VRCCDGFRDSPGLTVRPPSPSSGRFPPEPSGYLHIGHAKAALLNQYFAQNYNGKLIVRFDDTNPSKEKDEFEEAIIRDLATLGVKGDQVTHSSDHFDALLLMGEKLIKQGDVYIDDTPMLQMREERMVGTESKCRSHSVEENLALWKEMVAGSERGQQCAARFKFDMVRSLAGGNPFMKNKGCAFRVWHGATEHGP
jgi:glutamyl-tRNA synthetase